MIFPIWLHDNNEVIYSDIAHFVIQYKINQIIIWIPKNDVVVAKIKSFATNLSYCVEVPIGFVDESYTTVQAQVIQWDATIRWFTDCLAAMEITKRGLQIEKKS